MSSVIGTIPPFDIKLPATWDIYAETIDNYCEANAITDPSRKRAILLTVIGRDAYTILRSILSPAVPKDKSYDELIKILKSHFMPQVSIIYRRFLFHKRIQKADETISEYITELRQLAEECNFGATLTERLRDQLVCGLRDEAMQRRLLAETTLTFDDAIKRALAGEAAANQTREVQAQHTTSSTTGSSSSTCQLYHEKRHNVSGNKKASNTSNRTPCASCGGTHKRESCKFRDAECHSCKKKGHISKVCRSKNSGQPKQKTNYTNSSAHQLDVSESDEEDHTWSENNSIHCLIPGNQQPRKVRINVKVNGQPLNMEVDSGSNFSVISYDTYKHLWPKQGPTIMKSQLQLKDYQRNPIQLLGSCDVTTTFKNYKGILQLLVTRGSRTSLLGLNWFATLGLSIQGINQISENDTSLDKILREFSDVFSDQLGTYTGPTVTLPIDPKVPPRRFKARNVPLALRPRIEDELNRLQREGVIEPIQNPRWSTPIVPVIKPTGAIRLCGDYKITINTALSNHPYPIPAVTSLLSNLQGGKLFAKIDMAQAYLQLPVDNASAEAQTIITHRGAYKVKRLQFGVSVAPGIFQQIMDEALKDVQGVTPYFDDVLIRAANQPQLCDRIRQVLMIFRKYGLRAKKEKCLFGEKSIDFLGYRIDASGLHPSTSKLEAIHNAPTPSTKSELQAFLGLLNFYNGFLRDKATVAEPLHRLLDKNATWKWTTEHEQSFKTVKKLLSSNSVLVPFDGSLPTTLTCDASPYGVGAVLSQTRPDGKIVTVAFASRTLSSTERNYAQIDKEALALISGVKKFHHFLYGRNFTLVTDHKPLLGLFTTTKPTPDILSPRMLRWTVLLNAYSYTLVYKPGATIGHADALSRLSCRPPQSSVPEELPEIFFLSDLPAPPITASDVAKFTLKDPVLSRVLTWVWRGWPVKTDKSFQPFSNKKSAITVHKNCLLWGNRVIIPEVGHQQVLEELHLNHPGIVRMKALARSYVWWPNIDSDIEKFVAKCTICQQHQNSPPQAPIHHWEVPRNPWSRLHVDFAGPFQGENFLIIVDAHSKWLDVKRMKSTTADNTIIQLRELFATHGIPDSIVSDNGPQFTSEEFRKFCTKNLIKHILVSPYHASSNGQAERMVQTTKGSLKKIINGNWHCRLASFLLTNHITPSTATGFSPAELLMGRRLKTCLDHLHPDYWRDKQLKQDITPAQIDRSPRSFQQDEPVYVRSYSAASPWVPATVTTQTGPVSYEATTPEGKRVRRHVDLMKKRPDLTPESTSKETHVEQPPDAPNSSETPRPQRTRIRPSYLDDYLC